MLYRDGEYSETASIYALIHGANFPRCKFQLTSPDGDALANEINALISDSTARIDEVRSNDDPSVNDTQEAAVAEFTILKLTKMLQAMQEA